MSRQRLIPAPACAPAAAHPARRRAARTRQRGIATVLIVLLTGLGLTAGVLGTVSYVRDLQEQDRTAHAQTQAQMKAWTGAEVVQQYLGQLDGTALAALLDQTASRQQPLELQMQGTGVEGVIAARIVGIDKDAGTITARITGVGAPGTRAEARSVLEVVYGAEAGSPSTPRPSVLTYNRNLKLSGSITVHKDAVDTTPYEISVLGDIDTSGNSITGVKNLVSTGSIHITSGSSFDLLHANCDVNIEGSVTAALIKARRNVCATGTAGSGSSGTIMANGSVTTQAGSDRNGTIYARAQAEGVESCRAPGFSPAWGATEAPTCLQPQVNGVHFNNGNAGAQTVETKGDVSIESGTVRALRAQGSLTVNSNASVNTSVNPGTIGGTLTKPSWNSTVHVKLSPGYVANPPVVSKVKIDTDTFNAYDIEADANFAFKMENGYRKVTVRNVEGIADGTYFLGNYPGGGYKDYLCTEVTGSKDAPDCTSPARTETKTICKGYSDYNGCFSYNASTGWTVVGTSMAPGVAWFEGNLEVASGTYYNTFIATGNIKTSGQHVTYAPNYAGYNGKADGETYAPQGVCTNSQFPSIRPSQFCNADGSYRSVEPGDYAFMAGSRADDNFDDIASYQGGNITLGSSSKVYGNVRAGNEFSSGGNTTIHGFVSALALGSKVANSLGGSTTFDLRNLPKTFKLQGPGGSEEAGGPGGVRLKWSRYL